MSQSPQLDRSRPPFDRPSDGPTVLESPEAVRRVLHLLDDADCRAILEATGEAALSAAEIEESCDVPSSTLYRKLDRLSDADLLAEGLRVRADGKHTREYERRVDDVVVSVGDDGALQLELATS